MAKWWETQMVDASQQGFANPDLALQVASSPDELYTGQQQDHDEEQARESKSGFMGWLGKTVGKVDGALSNIPGWGVTKEVGSWAFAPVDKLATGARWAYSNVISQPLSTSLIMAGKANIRQDYSTYLSPGEWSDAYHQAEHLSPGQAAANYGAAAGELAGDTGESTPFQYAGPSYMLGLGKGNATDQQRRQAERLLYDTDYWRKRLGWKYDVGTGAADFVTLMASDPANLAVSAATKAVKLSRSVQIVEKEGKLVRERGKLVEGARKLQGKSPETLEEVSNGKKMTDFFEWVNKPGAFEGSTRKTSQEIAAHPIWGRGRRVNDFKQPLSDALSTMSREDMPTMYRFFAGDAKAAGELAERGNQTLNTIGKMSENRALVDSAKFDPEMLAYFADQAVPASTVSPLKAGTKLMQPPYPRPATGEAAQKAWDAQYGELAAKAELHMGAAQAINSQVRPLGAAANTLQSDILRAQSWKDAKVQLMQDEVTDMITKSQSLMGVLGANAGRTAEEFSPTASGLFGSMRKSYRAGGLAFRDTEAAAGRKFANKVTDRKGKFAIEGARSGFYGQPLRIVQAFGDRAPVGRINHNEPDSVDRVLDMLKQVPALGREQRMTLLNQYANAGDKVGKARALEGIKSFVVHHLATTVNGLDGEVASIIEGMINVGTAKTVDQLLGKIGRSSIDRPQAFTSAVDEAGVRVDATSRYMEDGVAYGFAPQAKAQLAQTDALLPIQDLVRVFERNSGAIKTLRKAGGTANDSTKIVMDNFNTLWKASTLLRGAYTIRMASDEMMLAGIKFGFLSHLVAGGSKGTRNFVLNRGQYLNAELGRGSYSPSTGAGVDSPFAIVKLGEDEIIEAANKRRATLRQQIAASTDKLEKARLGEELKNVKTTRIRVNKALPVARARISMEKELHAGLEKDRIRYQKEYDEIVAARAKTYQYQGQLDTAAAELAAARMRAAELRGTIGGIRKEIPAVRQDQADLGKVEPALAAQVAVHAEPLDELTALHKEAQKFLKQAKKAAGSEKVRWGDKDWKYDAARLDELTAWEAKAAKTLRSQQVKVGGAKSAQDLFKQQSEEFDNVIAKLTGDKQWWGTALQAAENRAAEARQGLGKASSRAHYKIPDADRMTSLQDKLADISSRMADHQNVMDEFTDYANEILRTAVAATGRRQGTGTFEAFGYKVPQAFSTAGSSDVPSGWQNSIPRDQISSDKAYAALIARGEAADIGRAMQTGGWKIVQPEEPQHMASWTHALNRQFAQDEVFVRLAEDGSGKSAMEWLKTPEGRQHLKDLGAQGRNPEQFVQDAQLTLDKYLPEETGLRAKMVDREDITRADLVKAIAEGDRPSVHGQEIMAMLGLMSKDTGMNMLDRMIQKAFNRMGAIPSDVMSRQPTYLRFQEARYKDLLGQELSYRAKVGKADTKLTPEELEKITHASDKLARKDISQIVYDPQRTTASEALRWIAPFFSAHADGLARWGGMIAEQPQMLTKVARVYNAPVAANLVTDSEGNHVGLDGYANIIDPTTGKIVGRKFVPMSDRTIHFKMPWAPKGSGGVPITINALNTILPGDPWFNPGSGPLVQVAGSQIAKASPGAGDFLQWAKILPYGPSGSISEAVTPKYMRAIYDAWKGADPDNEAYQKAYQSVYNMKVAQYYESEGKESFTLKEVENEAKHFLNMEILEAWASPAQTKSTPLTGTPYQFFVDQYAQMRQVDPEGARDKFLAKFGPEYMPFTASLTKSMGIAATVSADAMAQKYKDQISADPDMAAFWVGNVYNGGPFSSSVYQNQFDQAFGDVKAREHITAGEAIAKTQEFTGWSIYTKAMNGLDAALLRSGFTSYTQKGAEGFLEAKQKLVAGISKDQPAWGQAFNTTDRGLIPSRIKSFTIAVQDERLMTDPMRQEMQPLAQYLAARNQLKKILASRGSSSLSFDVRGKPIGPNADIGQAWRQVSLKLKNDNTAFADLYNRYLSNDDLQ